ncbi:phosphotriesterase-related protein [Contarinia nasturtii]|uniref:phosphotriesterase-related protein n=1 Tax=Contarinia nasturtii TaxID=265458 RepID=UPI0012D41790|nr:phosphotriesterase-related protein [Contarinia nasturtii]
MKVQSVLGDLLPSDLGRTLPHEHLSLDFHHFFNDAPKHLQGYVTEKQKISLGNIGVLRQYPYSSPYNLQFFDDDTNEKVIEDVHLYKKWCGSKCTIVENTTHGIRRDLTFYREVAKKTGVNVIAGAGHYLEMTQDNSELSISLEQMSDLYRREIVFGVDVSSNKNGSDIIKCGFLGEIASNWPISDFEKRAIKASADVQSALGCAVTFHPARDSRAPFEIMRLYLEAGGKADKCVMSHLDRTIHDDDMLLEFAKLGMYCQFDLFGTEVSFYQLAEHLDMPSDAQRMDKIISLVDEGYLDRILMSHDIHTKHRLIGFGGHGYAHIINNVLPKLKLKGLTDEQIDNITITNPSKWLEFNI